ncbi:DEAD/DEAH box helicase family protein [Acinetobacter chengduensis]|uniref:Uncharacterized protein n=1 Tax=Acinetobacter chengduensis TaxID=2420890 RepID=A0ABX9TT40_9GAMM|nr:DEAD/DEAH box helicase family protein [Acinetobacter chengduensis]RLL18976.1 hypothetical protein D9K81_14550 [Acinetobacter chengduensis]
MDLQILLSTANSLDLLKNAKEIHQEVQAEKARSVPLVAVLTGNEIEENKPRENFAKNTPNPNYFDLVREYFKSHIQGNTVKHPLLGEISVNSGDSWGKIKRGLDSKNERSMLIPCLLKALENGKCTHIETARSGQKRDYKHFAYLQAKAEIAGNTIEFCVSVAIDSKTQKWAYNIMSDQQAQVTRDAQKYEGVTPVAGFDSTQDEYDSAVFDGLNITILSSTATKPMLIEGRQNKVKTAKGTRLDTNLAIIEAGDLIASHDHLGNANKSYPQELQPRDRSRQSSQAQIHSIAKDLDPESLGRSSRADSGAPIIGPDRVVESGNGRSIAIQLAYKTGQADEYRAWLLENAEYLGLSTAQIESMKEPVLVRVRKTETDRSKFAVEANQDDKLSYSATERAKSDAKRLTAGLLELFNPDESGNLISASNSKFISGFLDSLGPDEAAQYITTDGKPTQALVMRIKSAVFSKAYNDDRLLEMVADQTKSDLQNVLNALSMAAPKFIEAQAVSGAMKGQIEDVSSSIVDSIEKSLDKRIVNAILDATNLIEKAKYNNHAISEYISQLGLFGDLPEGVGELAVFIMANARSAKKLSIAFKAMASFAEKSAVDGLNMGLFGEPEPVSILDAVSYANRALLEEYGDSKSQINMFDGTSTSEQGQKDAIQVAAAQSATSPVNGIAEPSDADKISGNYLKGKVQLDGMVIAIENPAGSIRAGTDENGDAWKNTMMHHYGYFEGTEGADGDELDVFIKHDAQNLNGPVFVINQINPKTGDFDEHKIVLGATDEKDAKQIYLSNYDENWQGLKSISELTIEEFKTRLATDWAQSLNAYDDSTNSAMTMDKPLSLLSELKQAFNNNQPLQMLKLALACLMYKGTAPAFEQVNPLVNYTTKKGKTLQGIVVPFETVKYKADAQALDPYTFMYERQGWFVRLKHLANIDDALLTPEQILLKKGQTNGTATDPSKTDTSELGAGTGSKNGATHESGTAGALAGSTSNTDGSNGPIGNASNGLSEGNASGIGSGSNHANAGKRKRNFASANSATNDGKRSSADGEQGSFTTADRDRHAIQSAKTAGSELSEKEQLQKDAEGIPVEWADIDNIRKTLPYLLPEQQDDVAKAEKRLLTGNKNGILFTNGTGTGKTFTGLGLVKRFVSAGKGNILIVSMNDKIVRDFVKSGKPLGLNIHQLNGIDDNGGEKHSIVATTYANLGQNETLADKHWDLIVVDESHNLMQSEEGKETAALRKIRALTGHHMGFYDWFDNRHRAERPPKIMVDAPMFDADNKPIMNADGTQKTQQVEGNSYAPGPEYDAWQLKQAEQQKIWKKNWNTQPAGRTKVIFLSATPWSYIKTIEWAEGYLFDYVAPEKRWNDEAEGTRYNSGDDRSNFYMRNFGYTMRYNKLTRPDGKVDSGVNEREFANKLKAEGAVSGRELVVNFDYDRKFILIESEAGKEIDRGIDLLWESKDDDGNYIYGDLLRAVLSRFNYLSRERLLEAIKADAVVDQIKKSFALNRKVVVFHDYNEGGGFSPFSFMGFGNYADDSNRVKIMQAQYERFSKEHPDLVQLNLSFKSPIETLTNAFPNALLFNGRVSKGQRAKNADLFNEDGSGRDLIIVQSDAGATGISFHDTTGKHQRVIFNLGLPKRPAKLRQTEGRIYRVGQASNAIQRYLTTGTKWETSAFANTIAQRAETVDNLAKGDDAVVSIRDSIINAYENAEYFEPSDADGKGGKEYDEENARIARMTPFDKALTFYYNKGKNRDKRKDKIGKDWYATPEPLGLKMMQWAGVHKGDDVLEPSAGDGAIGRWIPADANGTMIEPSVELAARAQLANTTAKIETGSFEDHNTMIKYDAIVMNPPFGHAGALALEHLKKACKHLREGGRVVALIPQSANLERGLEAWHASREGSEFYTAARITLPSSTFENANTGVNTFILILERHASPDTAPNMRNLDYSHVSSNVDLFEAIRDVQLAPRQLRTDEQLMEYGLVLSPFRSSHILTGVGVTTPEIREALLANRFVYENSKDPNTLECYARNIKSIMESLKDVQKIMPHTHDAYDGWQHDGVFERVPVKQIKVDLTKYIHREMKATLKTPIVVQERGNAYVLLSGYERFRLAKEKDETFIPSVIIPEQYVIGKTTLAKAYKLTPIPLDPEVFAQHLFSVLDDEAVRLLA